MISQNFRRGWWQFCWIAGYLTASSQLLYSRSRRDVTRLSNKRSPYLFGVATANKIKVTTPNKYGAEIIARMSDWENDNCWGQAKSLGAHRQHLQAMVDNVLLLMTDSQAFRTRTLPAIANPNQRCLWKPACLLLKHIYIWVQSPILAISHISRFGDEM